MPRFIVRYNGNAPRPQDVVDRVRAIPGAAVVDDSGRMMLVDAPGADHVRAAVGSSDDWLVTPEKTYPVPDTRKRVLRPPAEE